MVDKRGLSCSTCTVHGSLFSLMYWEDPNGGFLNGGLPTRHFLRNVKEKLSNNRVVKPCLETEESLQADRLGNWELGWKQGGVLMQACVEQACSKAIS